MDNDVLEQIAKRLLTEIQIMSVQLIVAQSKESAELPPEKRPILGHVHCYGENNGQ